MIPLPLILLGAGAAVLLASRKKKSSTRTARSSCPSGSTGPGKWTDFRQYGSAFEQWYGYEHCVSVNVEYAPGRQSVQAGEPFVLNLNFDLAEGDTFEVRGDGRIFMAKKIASDRIAVWIPKTFRDRAIYNLDLSIWPPSLAFAAIKFNMEGNPMVRVQPDPGRFTLSS